MTPIDKISFNETIKQIRKQYHRHTNGKMPYTEMLLGAHRLLNGLEGTHIRALVDLTAEKAIKKLESLQAGFGLDLEHNVDLFYEHGKLAAYIKPTNQGCWCPEIYIGQREKWDQIACYEDGDKSDLYTKKMARRWKSVEEFDFPRYLQKLRESIDVSSKDDMLF